MWSLKKDYFGGGFFYHFFILTLLSLPIFLLLLKAFWLDLAPTFDADIHNYLLSYINGDRPPKFSGIYYIQALSFKPFSFSSDTIILLSKLFCTFFFFSALMFISLLQKETFLFNLSFLCAICLSVPTRFFWYYIVTHGVWYYALNVFFLSFFIFYSDRLYKEKDSLKIIFFLLLCFLAIFNKISIVLALSLYLFCSFYSRPKRFLFFIAPISAFTFFIYYMIQGHAYRALHRKLLSRFIYPKTAFFEKDSYLFSSIFDFLVLRTKTFFSELGLNPWLVLILMILPFFLKGAEQWRKRALVSVLLFCAYFVLSLMGKFIFLSPRYNIDLFVLYLTLFVSLLAWLLSLKPKILKPIGALCICIFCLSFMNFDIKEEYRSFQKKNKDYDRYLSFVQTFSKQPSLADLDHLFTLKKHNLAIKPINVGYGIHRDKKRKKSALDFDKSFFKKPSFVFYLNTCSWGHLWRKNRRLVKCSERHYLDFKVIKEKYQMRRETCFGRYCAAFFVKRKKSH